MPVQRDESYLLERQRDENRLRRIAHEEFAKARDTGRLVAVVGSYATKHFGYPEWKGLTRRFIRECAGCSDDQKEALRKTLRKKDERFPELDVMDLAELLANRDRHGAAMEFEKGRRHFARHFGLKGRVCDAERLPNVAKALIRELGVSRYVTLNYDLELEWEAFLSDFERDTHSELPRDKVWNDLIGPPLGERRRIERHVPARGNVVSEVLDREDGAQLIEFAVDHSGDRFRILHLHGRIDDPMGMLVTRRDYRNRYRQGGFSKIPFEYGLRLIFTGNPILFVGIGLTESDVTHSLEQLLSDNPNRRAVPVFLVWDSSGDTQYDAVKRMLFNRKFGVHVLFDHEVVSYAREANYEKRLGDELDALPGNRFRSWPGPRAIRTARRLVEPIRNLGKLSSCISPSHVWEVGHFRSPQYKYLTDSRRVNMWHQERTQEPRLTARPLDEASEDSGNDPLEHLSDAFAEGSPIKAVVGDPGSRRGALASLLGRAFEKRYLAEPEPLFRPRDPNLDVPANGDEVRIGDRVVVINGSFITETDSVFGILSGAYDGVTAQQSGESRTTSTTRLLEEIRSYAAAWEAAAKAGVEAAMSAPEARSPASDEVPSPRPVPGRLAELTLVINGMERLIAHDGSALSTELDAIIRVVVNLQIWFNNQHEKWASWLRSKGDKIAELKDSLPRYPSFPIRLILIGTPRLRRYLSVIAPDHQEIVITRCERNSCSQFEIAGLHFEVEQDCYFTLLAKTFGLQSVDDAYVARRPFFNELFDRALLTREYFDEPELAFAILKALAFIGQPTERPVLFHVPALWGSEHRATAEQSEKIAKTVDALIDKHMILKIGHFPANNPGPGGRRLGLHKSLIAEIRQRYGMPVSDARLSAGFNIGLYAAHPLDSFTPDQRWHREIGTMIDFLMGRHRDALPIDSRIEKAGEVAKSIIDADPAASHELKRIAALRVARLAEPVMSDCLRAALSLVRSYHSTPALLMYANRDLDPWTRDGPLTEHAERLTELIRLSKEVATARQFVGAQMGPDRRALGTPAFYPDDLVWLHNELGVVRTTQGSLHEARAALEEAIRINEKHVDNGERHQNWRRISLNLVQVLIDSGEIESAEERLRDIESAVNNVAKLFKSELPIPSNAAEQYATLRDYVVDQYTKSGVNVRTSRLDPYYPTDLILTTALVLAHRAVCQHLRGALALARKSFDDAIAILERLNEQRAYSFFQRHSAALHFAERKQDEAEAALRRCVAAAGPSRQTDIDHSGRIQLSHYGVLIPTEDKEKMRTKVIPQLVETLRYATISDMYRLQIEAMQNMALVHYRNGDADSAMRFSTDALAIASRCGFGLRQVSLRILTGRVLALRGDRISAEKLLRRASQIAASLHYERAVETAEDALVELG